MIFELTVNYRSHSGIVNAASSIVDIISHFWPESMDKMEQERGIVPGRLPIFFTGWESDSERSMVRINFEVNAGSLEYLFTLQATTLFQTR